MMVFTGHGKLATFFSGFLMVSALGASESSDRARRLILEGDGQQARAMLEQAAKTGTLESLTEYAEFLERFGSPSTGPAYEKVLGKTSDPAGKRAIARKLVLLDLMRGERVAAERHLDIYQKNGGTGLSLPPVIATGTAAGEMIPIPGPIRSFARMAAISSDLTPPDVLPAVARNVVTNGYQASNSNDALEQTEYLKLVFRYLSQARELKKFAGESETIVIESCESEKVGELLKILGYRMRGGCGSEVVLETVNASRAFLTTDAGFPLAELEQALRTNRKFSYPFPTTQVPVMYGSAYWTGARDKGDQGEFIDSFLNDPSLCRLYLGFSKLDPVTSEALRKAVPVQRIKAYSHVLDFFGGMFEIRNGKAVYPGNTESAKAWADLVGVHPDKGAEFLEKLMAKDDGWLASLFDALLRIEGPVRDYLTEPARMKRFYSAVRGRITSPGPARPVFRSNADMMLLTTRLWVKDGKPHIPGNLEIWKNLFVKHPHGKYDGKLTKLAQGWKEPDDVLEALFALCRKAVENEPLKVFMALTDLDRRRTRPLEPATVDRLAREYRFFGNQYAIFNDAPNVSDKTILQFLDTAAFIGKARDNLVRADAAGIFQSLVGIWQILCRHDLIPPDKSDAVLAEITSSFAAIKEPEQIFDVGRNGVKTIMAAASATNSEDPHARMLDLLAGDGNPRDTEAHARLIQEMTRVFDSQRILSLKMIFDLADHLESLSRGERLNTALVNRLASRMAEVQLPRASMTGAEKNAFSFGYWTEKHIEDQRKLNLRAQVERAAGDAERLKKLRGLLTPFLRDTLVAFNYAHYAPPGAQILYTNPLFVRSHDFLGVQGANQTWRNTEVFGTGWPANAGGRLIGSLAGLGYALAEAEQNFLIPSQTQALIWGDLVPQMIISAKIPRWWQVTPAQMHWLALHLRYGRSLLAESAIDTNLLESTLESLSRLAPPRRARQVEQLLREARVADALDEVTPAEYFALAADMLAKRKDDSSILAAEIRQMASADPKLTYAAISSAFGTPKPTLANSYRPELLRLRTFPTLMGYSSRIMAESWESNTLYWADLADAAHYRPSQLNNLVPEWTQKVVERIFASHLEDWPALLRSLRTVGGSVREEATRPAVTADAAALR